MPEFGQVRIDRSPVPARDAHQMCSCALHAPQGGPWLLVEVGDAVEVLREAGVPGYARIHISGQLLHATWEERDGGS